MAPHAPSQAGSTDPYAELNPEGLTHPDSMKWTRHAPGVIALWVADMDFPVSPAIRQALAERLERSLGYPPNTDAALVSALQSRLSEGGLSDLPAEGFAFMPGVVPGLYAAVHALSTPGERVATMTPIYHPFHLAITEQGREVAGAPLRAGASGYEIDWEALEAAVSGARLLMLCHPHNPTGRIWGQEELARLRDLVMAHDLYVISDELHAELRFDGRPFESFAADPRVRDRTITVTGPCKAYNTAGLGIGVMLSHNPELLTRVRGAAGGLMGHPSALSYTMWRAALSGGRPWLEETLGYLQGNRDLVTAFVQEHWPWARVFPAEATYLAWLDLRAHPQAAQMADFLLREAGVALNPGSLFVPDAEKPAYEGFVRLNFATGRPLLREALERMDRALR